MDSGDHTQHSFADPVAALKKRNELLKELIGERLFTREEVKAMTPEEVHKNYDKIRRSMRKW